MRKSSLRWAREAENYRAERLRPAAPSSASSMAIRRDKSSICFCRKQAMPLRLRCSFTAAGGARSMPRCFSQMARGLNAHGVAVAVAGYDLCPNVSIADIIEQMRRACVFLWQRLRPAPDGLRTFGRRPFGRRDGRDRLAFALSEGAARSGSGRIFDLRRVRPRPAGRHQRESGFAARCRGSAPSSRRCSGRSPPGRIFDAVAGGLESGRVQASEPRLLAETWRQTRRADALRRNSRHKSFHRHRRAGRSAERDGGPRRRIGAIGQISSALSPV